MTSFLKNVLASYATEEDVGCGAMGNVFEECEIQIFVQFLQKQQSPNPPRAQNFEGALEQTW